MSVSASNGTGFSCSAWVYPMGSTDADQKRATFLSILNPALTASQRYGFVMSYSSNIDVWNLGRGFQNFLNPTNDNFQPLRWNTAEWVAASDNWYHVVFTYNSTTRLMTFYRNGVTIGTHSTDTTYNFQLSDIQFGYRHDTDVAEAFNGRLDDVRIYNRVLTSQEVTTLFNTTA